VTYTQRPWDNLDDRDIAYGDYDADIHEMLSGNLYTRDWTLVSRHLPDGSLVMYYAQTCDLLNSTSQQRMNECPVTLCPEDDVVMVEVMPPNEDTLEEHHEYFRDVVFNMHQSGELLINVCTQRYKTPLFNISGCIVARHTSPFCQSRDLSSNVIAIGEYQASLLIPTSVVTSIFEALSAVDIIVLPDVHDAKKYTGSRVQPRSGIEVSRIPQSKWCHNETSKDINRYINCNAVATATFTVSAVVTPYEHTKGIRPSRRRVKFVVHNVRVS